ncbi:MAG: ribonuclease HII [Desulfobacteraceae bacterium]
MITTADNLSLFPKSKATSEIDTLYYESMARKAGYSLIAGVDEAGRGPLAGPVVAAAVMVPDGVILEGIRDSKEMTETAREKAFSIITQRATAVSVGVISQKYIDETNILKASLEAMKCAVLSLEPKPDYFLVDGIYEVPVPIAQKCLKKGDRMSLSISAASVVAKVYRDRIMRGFHEMFPAYGFSENKGYGTARHRAAIKACGCCPIHRLTFRGVR